MITREGIGRDIARLIIWYPFRWVVGTLPLRAALRLIETVGDTHVLLSRSSAAHIRALARDIAGETGRDEAREFFRTYYRSQLVAFLFPSLTAQSIPTLHRFEGLQHVDTLLQAKRGCLLVHPHFGPIHLPLFHLGLAQYPVKQLGFFRRPPSLSAIGERVSFRLRQRLEALIPAEIIQANAYQRSTFKHLHAGGVLLTTGDGAGRGEQVGVHESFPFLGRTRDFPLGPARLALKTGAAFLPMFTLPGASPQTFVTRIAPPLDLTDGDERLITQAFVSQFEAQLRQAPSHWHFLDEWPPKDADSTTG